MNVSFIVMLSCGTVTSVTIVTPARHTHLKFVSIINWISSEGLDRMELLWREEGLISTVINSRYLQMLVKTLKCCRWWLMVRWSEVTRDLLSWTITRAAPGHRPPPPRDGLSCYQHSLLQRHIRVPQHHLTPRLFQMWCTLFRYFFRSAEVVGSDSNDVSINTIFKPPFPQIPDILPSVSEWSWVKQDGKPLSCSEWWR